MRTRFVLLSLLVCLALAALACAPLPVTTPAPDVTIVPITDTPFTDFPPTDVPVTGVPAVPTLEPIPLHVGYGYRGTWFELYFTDPTNPVAKQNSGGPEEAVIASIDAARLTLDVAFYSFSLREVANALLRARDRGVAVRVVMESDNRERSVPQALLDGGISILGDRREGLMHDKFIIIDRSEVWTGSMNYTVNGVYEDNNILIHIRSVKVAENYLVEFEEMYTDDLFGTDSIASTPNPFLTVDGTDIETYFSPDDGVAARLVSVLATAQESVYFMAYSFTSDDLGQTLRNLYSAGLTVKGVMDESQVKSNQGTEFDPFIQAGIAVRIDGISGLMHHKVMIIDRKIVVLGSYNFTASAEDRNDENLLIIYNPQIAELFLAEFERVYAQGTVP